MQRSLLVSISLVIGLSLATASAQGADRVKKADVKKHPFQVGSLGLTIGTFRPHLRDVLSFVRSAGQIEVRIENGTDQSIEYSPKELTLIGSDDQQVNLRGRMQLGIVNPDDDRLEPVQARTIAPRAKLKEFYELTGPVKLPARLYYGSQQLAVIID
jgi:hypothetical protein